MWLLSKIYGRLKNTPKRLRGKLLSYKLSSCGKNLRVYSHLLIRRPGQVSIGNNVGIDRNVDIHIVGTGILKIRDNVWIGRENIISCHNEVVIEDYALFGPHVHIYDSNHGFEDINTPIVLQPSTSKGPVRIGKGCWIGAGAKILSGVTIGDNSVIGANSVVISDIPPYCVGGGNPARVLKQFNLETQQWEQPISNTKR